MIILIFDIYICRSNFSEIPALENTQFSLSIANSELEDQGLYTCVAKNDYGSDKKDIRLMLVGMSFYIYIYMYILFRAIYISVCEIFAVGSFVIYN